ncbi:MAG: RAD55 family ATPase [Halobacteriaceae archaeon]
MAGRLSTGIEVLDRRLDGGFPPGSIVAYVAPPASQAELLLYELTRARPTLYLTTERTEQSVQDALDRTPAPTGDPRIRYVSGDAPLDNAQRLFRNISGEANLIVDTVDVLERLERTRYRNFLNALQNHMQNIGGITVLHGLRGSSVPQLRDTTEHMADVVLSLTVNTAGAEMESRLSVPKFRGGRAPDEVIKLELGERVRIDTSRDIA